MTSILNASSRNDLARAKALLKENAQLVHSKDEWNQTPLHLAAKNNHIAVLKCLLHYNSGINATDKDGFTPLHWAAVTGSAEAATLLLAQGADPDIAGNNGETPANLARRFRHLDVLNLLRGRKHAGKAAKNKRRSSFKAS